MKNMYKSWKIYNKIIIALIAFWLFSMITWWINTVSSWFKSTWVNQIIDAHWECRQVRHTWTKSHFIPSRTSLWWQSFIDNKPSDVTIWLCPIDWGWSSWSYGSYWSCNQSCWWWTRTRTLTRTCTNPSPEHWWANCIGSSTTIQSQSCNTQACVTPINWACNNSTVNSCSSWTFSDRADTSTQHRWSCNGSNGWTSATNCSKNKPIVPTIISWSGCSACPNWTESIGSLPSIPVSEPWWFFAPYVPYTACKMNSSEEGRHNNGSWWSNWSQSNSIFVYSIFGAVCSIGSNNIPWEIRPKSTPLPVNGVCNNSTTNSCSSWTFSDRADTTTEYRWSCNGSNGWSNATNCAKNKPSTITCGPWPIRCNWSAQVEKYWFQTGDNVEWRCVDASASCLPTYGFFKNCTGWKERVSCSTSITTTHSWTGCSSCPNGSSYLGVWTLYEASFEYYGCILNWNQVWKNNFTRNVWAPLKWTSWASKNGFIGLWIAQDSVYWAVCSTAWLWINAWIKADVSWKIGQ